MALGVCGVEPTKTKNNPQKFNVRVEAPFVSVWSMEIQHHHDRVSGSQVDFVCFAARTPHGAYVWESQ